MITGCVTDDGVPQIVLPVQGRSWTAVIDTGFNGDLELPDALKALVIRPAGPVWSHLAGGQVIVEKEFEVSFPSTAKS